MLLYGDHTTIPTQESGISCVGLFTYMEDVPKLNIQIPYNVAVSDELSYDSLFAKSIIENDDLFLELMTLMFALYEGRSIYCIITKDNDYFEFVTESLFKFIQERYGYTSAMINDYNDYNYLDKDVFSFSLNGIYNFDIDKQRYVTLMMHKYPDLIFKEGVDEHGNTYRYIPEGFLYYRRF